MSNLESKDIYIQKKDKNFDEDRYSRKLNNLMDKLFDLFISGEWDQLFEKFDSQKEEDLLNLSFRGINTETEDEKRIICFIILAYLDLNTVKINFIDQEMTDICITHLKNADESTRFLCTLAIYNLTYKLGFCNTLIKKIDSDKKKKIISDILDSNPDREFLEQFKKVFGIMYDSFISRKGRSFGDNPIVQTVESLKKNKKEIESILN